MRSERSAAWAAGVSSWRGLPLRSRPARTRTVHRYPPSGSSLGPM